MGKMDGLIGLEVRGVVPMYLQNTVIICLREYVDKLEACANKFPEVYKFMTNPDVIRFYRVSDAAYVRRLVDERKLDGEIIKTTDTNEVYLLWTKGKSRDVYFICRDIGTSFWKGTSLTVRFQPESVLRELVTKQATKSGTPIQNCIGAGRIITTVPMSGTSGITIRIPIA